MGGRRIQYLGAMAAVIAAALLAPAVARADVQALGDVFPLIDDPDNPGTNIPNLPQLGGDVPGGLLIVGGTNWFVGGTSTGQVTIDIPSDTDPLIAADGYVGGNTLGLGQVRVLQLNSELRLTRSLTLGWEGQAFLEVAAGARTQVLRTGNPDGSGAIMVEEDPDISISSNQDPTADWDLILGAWEGSQGFAEVDGFASLLLSGNAAIGLRGQGRIDMTNGSRMVTVNKAAVGVTRDIATNDNAIGSGYVMVDGPGSRWNVGIVPADTPPLPGGGTPPAEDVYDEASLTIGAHGRGTVEVRNKGWVRVETDTIIGDQPGSYGVAMVNGADSLLWSLDDMFIGTSSATGELHIDALGVARADGSTALGGTSVGALGLIELGGGALVSPNLTSAGVIRGDGRIESANVVINGGDIRNAAGVANLREKLLFTGVVNNNDGNIESIGGEMEFQQVVNHTGANADLVGIDAIFRFKGGLNSSAGAGIFLEDTVVYVPAGQALSSAARMTLWAGESTLVGDLTLTSSNSLNVVLGEGSFGRLEVVGDATIDGLVQIALEDSYLPQIGDSFEIIDAESLAGTFSAVLGGGGGAGFWEASYTASSAILSYVADIVSPFTADFDGNGVVDGGDLSIWEMNFGLSPATMADGDANGDGIVDGADFNIWQEQLGSMVPAAPAAGTVPEPGSFAMAALALAGLAGLRRRVR
jgi:T5SS/PEP-CTERM-associated repeat protein